MEGDGPKHDGKGTPRARDTTRKGCERLEGNIVVGRQRLEQLMEERGDEHDL
jgi:hypothetical protein